MPARPQNKSALANLSVKDAMRRQIVSLYPSSPIRASIPTLIKHKVNALLVSDKAHHPLGVVSKTDLMGAYYALLPLESPLGSIMVSPPLFCSQDDSLESALESMRESSIYRLYVKESDADEIPVGVLAFPDIVGMLYMFCRSCDRSHHARQSALASDEVARLKVKDVMTGPVLSFGEDDSLMTIVEGLSAYRFGAVLIRGADDYPTGVISKTDLILAYYHGVSYEEPARAILTGRGALSCPETDLLEDAIRIMIHKEVQRLFVHSDDPGDIVGVFSLSDAARHRSGSCRACISARIRVGDRS